MNSPKQLIISILFCFFIIGSLSAQTVFTMGSGSSGQTCNGVLYDNGGENGNYGAGRDDWFTIRPGSGAINIRFIDMDIASTDTLYFYNGESPAAETVPLQIGPMASNWVNNTGNMIQLGDQEVAATVQNPTGAITVHFVSAANSTCGAGFKLQITCAQPCQRIITHIDFDNSVPVPHLDEELNDGYYYIDFCPDDVIHFAAYGEYPDNNYSYSQSDAQSTFHWNFGTESMNQQGATSVNYQFPEGRGSEMTLTLSDVHNGQTCYAQTPIAIRLRGSADPLLSVPTLADVCQHQEIPFAVGYDANSANIVVGPIGSTEGSSLAVDSTVFIPDGPNCESALGSQCYSSSVNFTVFPAGATVTSAADILGVRLNIEHSFIGDINIKLKCPNGSSSMLLPDHCGNLSGACSSGSYFGIYYEPDNGCYPQNNPQGTGWNYCWSENSAYAQLSGYIFNAANVGNYVTSTVDSSNVAVGYPGGPGFVQGRKYYQPYTSFSNLIGCPLNGMWSIEVCDTWGSDNGYVFSWELTLDPMLMPQDWSYDVPVQDVEWSGGNITPTSDTTAVAINDLPGSYTYTFTIHDAFGCSYSRDLPVNVIQQPVPQLPDTLSICTGAQSVVLDPAFNYTGNPGMINYAWSNGQTTPTITVADTAQYSVTITTYNADRSLACTANDTVQVMLSPMPVAAFECDPLVGCSPVHVTTNNLCSFMDGEQHSDIRMFYQWTVTNGNGDVVATSTEANPSYNFENRGTYTVKLVVTTSGGCTDSLTKEEYIQVNAQPRAGFSSILAAAGLDAGGEVAFTNTSSTGGATVDDMLNWNWNFGDETGETFFEGVHVYQQSGWFPVTLTVSTDAGCSDEFTHTIHIPTPYYFYIPNAFSPDGDGINEIWVPQGSGVDENNYLLYIYDRDGRLLFSSNNLKQGWDGTSKGKPVPVGCYVYVIQTYTKDADPKEYTGTITLIR